MPIRGKSDFLISHLVVQAWDCYFQFCEIRKQGDTRSIQAVIATTGDNFWGKTRGTIEIVSDKHVCNTLGIKAGDVAEVILP